MATVATTAHGDGGGEKREGGLDADGGAGWVEIGEGEEEGGVEAVVVELDWVVLVATARGGVWRRRRRKGRTSRGEGGDREIDEDGEGGGGASNGEGWRGRRETTEGEVDVRSVTGSNSSEPTRWRRENRESSGRSASVEAGEEGDGVRIMATEREEGERSSMVDGGGKGDGGSGRWLDSCARSRGRRGRWVMLTEEVDGEGRSGGRHSRRWEQKKEDEAAKEGHDGGWLGQWRERGTQGRWGGGEAGAGARQQRLDDGKEARSEAMRRGRSRGNGGGIDGGARWRHKRGWRGREHGDG